MLPCLTPRAVQFLHSGVPEGRLRGIRAYRQLFDALRLTRNTAVADADLSYHLSLPSEATIRVRWHARLWLRMPLPSLGSIVGVHAAAPLLVDGVSLYELDGDARIAACCLPSLASLASGCATPRPRWHASQPLRAAHWEAALRPGGPADAVGSPAALVW